MSFTEQEFIEWAASYANRFGFDRDGKIMVAGWASSLRSRDCTIDELDQARRVVELQPPAFWREHDHAFFSVLRGIVWSRNTRLDAEARQKSEAERPACSPEEIRAMLAGAGWPKRETERINKRKVSG
jgi:hypothetical protein